MVRSCRNEHGQTRSDDLRRARCFLPCGAGSVWRSGSRAALAGVVLQDVDEAWHRAGGNQLPNDGGRLARLSFAARDYRVDLLPVSLRTGSADVPSAIGPFSSSVARETS